MSQKSAPSASVLSLVKRTSASERLDVLLRRELPALIKDDVSNSLIRKVVFGGGIRVNGRKIDVPDYLVKRGDTVQIKIRHSELARKKQEKLISSAPLVVLFEDDFLLAVDKASGIPTHPTIDRSRANLFDQCLDFLRGKNPNTKPYLGIHHRLDKDTSGVVIFSKSTEINQRLGDLFSNREIQKTYLAISISPQKMPTQRTWTTDNHLGVTGKKHGKSVYGSVKSGGDRAITDIEILESHKCYTAIIARPKTGRTHQIRSHLQSCGLPILGDELYLNDGDDRQSAKTSRLMLHAWRLEFFHPVNKRPISITTSIPREFAEMCPKLAKDFP